MVRRLTLTQLDITPTENSVMKHLTLFLLCFATISGFAQQDIVVNGSGLPGTYSTISAAVQAANPGDKILVSNQAFPYQEDTLFIDKDVTIMPYSASSYVAFEGDIQVTLDSISDLTFIGFDSDQSMIYSIFNDTTRNSLSTVNIVDCEFQEIRLDQPKTSLYMSYSTARRVYFSHGDIIGNSISEILSLGIFRDNTWGYGTNFYRSHQNTLGLYQSGYTQNVSPCGLFSGSVNFGSTETYSDTCNIIANDFTQSSGCDVTMNTTDFAFNIRNNRFKQAEDDKTLLIYQCCPSGIGTNQIINNDLPPRNGYQQYTNYYNEGVTLCLAYCGGAEPSHNFRDVRINILNNTCWNAYRVDIPQGAAAPPTMAMISCSWAIASALTTLIMVEAI